MVKYQLNSDAVSAEVITATPVERSNSPPIISKDTPTAMIPIVEDPYRMVARASGWVNVGDTNAKKMKRTIAPTRAPTSGRSEQLLERTALGDALIGRRRLWSWSG